MIAVALGLVLCTTPPPLLPPSESPQDAPRPQLVKKPPPPPPPPAKLALLFAPMSLFALSVYLELDVPIAGGVDFFGIVGGGAFGQLGGDLGLRYFINGTSLEGFYVDARASVFTLPALGYVLLGPGVLIGHSWRAQRVNVQVGIGFTSWTKLASNGTALFGARTTMVDILLLPGIEEPRDDLPAIQPAVRISIGPWF
jgi:hypothetical protein